MWLKKIFSAFSPPPLTVDRLVQMPLVQVMPVFFSAIGKGNTTLLDMVLDARPEIVNFTDPSGKPPLLLAMEKNRNDCFNLLLKLGADKNIPLETGPYPERLIHRAILIQNKECLRRLLLADADVTTPGNCKQVFIIPKYGKQLRVFSEDPLSPLEYAEKLVTFRNGNFYSLESCKEIKAVVDGGPQLRADHMAAKLQKDKENLARLDFSLPRAEDSVTPPYRLKKQPFSIKPPADNRVNPP